VAPSVSPYSSLTASATAGESASAAVRRVLENYKRALESRDIALYRSLKPDLSANEEKALRESFKVVKSQVVGMVEESIRIDPGGDRATVKVSRQDIINGRPTQRYSQTINFVRSGGTWLIQSMGQ